MKQSKLNQQVLNRLQELEKKPHCVGVGTWSTPFDVMQEMKEKLVKPKWELFSTIKGGDKK